MEFVKVLLTADVTSVSVLTAIRFLVRVTVTVTMEPAVMLLLSSSSKTAERQCGQKPDIC